MDKLAQEILQLIKALRAVAREEADVSTGKIFHRTTVMNPVPREIAIPDPSFRQLSAAFEETYGLDGIAQRYALPEGISPQDIQSYLSILLHQSGKPLDKMQALHADLVARNPVLGEIACDTGSFIAMYHLVRGAAMALNPDDLRLYMTAMVDPAGRAPGAQMHASEEYKSLRATFKEFCGKDTVSEIKWIPAPPTLQAIEKQIRNKI